MNLQEAKKHDDTAYQEYIKNSLCTDKYSEKLIFTQQKYINILEESNKKLNNILSKMYSKCFKIKNEDIEFDLEKMLEL